MRHARSRTLAALLVFALLLIPAAALAETTVTDVGHQTGSVSFDMMFPSVTYVHVGDTVTFTNKAKLTPHTVTFAGGDKLPAPGSPTVAAPSKPSASSWDGKGLLNSGIMEPGASYTTTFTAVGVFDYVCLLHPMMKGQIAVLPAGAPIPSADAQSAAIQMQQMDVDAQAKVLDDYYSQQTPSGTVGKDGAVTWSVITGAGFNGFDIEKFYPASLVISEGDSVAFRNKNVYEPHFVTFPTSTADKGHFFGPHGPDIGAMFMPMGGSVIDGTKLVSAGVAPNQSVTFSFPKAGTYSYICYLHDGTQMEGTVTVQPAGTYHAYLNGKAFVYDGSRAPHEHNGIVYIPVAAMIKALGGTVVWDADSQTVSASTNKDVAAQRVAAAGDGVKVVVNGKALTYGWDPKPHIHEGRVYVPAQALLEALGGRLTIDTATKTISMWVK